MEVDFKAMRYGIVELVGENCLTISAGQKIYDLIHPRLLNGEPVELDFVGAKRIASPFLNFAIAQLLSDIRLEALERLLKISNLNSVGNQVLDRVIDNAKRYYSDPRYKNAVDAMIQEQATCV